MVKYGSWVWSWLGTGIAPPATHPATRTPGTPLPHPVSPRLMRAESGQVNKVVGLISVDQLSLCAQISGFLGITEGYNLSLAGNPNDHKCIPGLE